ncbi:MAG: triose-phosphate isomerase [Oscillospiraceae bacterium]|nr:triose-phosphate isomerase [Oscillospiraceae bacterium]
MGVSRGAAAIAAGAPAAAPRGVGLGAQDVSEHEKGAYTGEVSGAQLRDLGAAYVLVGHSERRQYHAETDAAVSRKARAALAAGLRPIVCVGESLQAREAGRPGEILAAQITGALAGLTAAEARGVIAAYEPVWAIGTGRTASPEDAESGCARIRSEISALFGSEISDAIPILYGGSMNEKNAEALLRRPNIDGGLIGGASLDPAAFSAIAAAAAAILEESC